jgi:hypothetical protein
MLRDEHVGAEASWCGGEANRSEQCERVHRRLKRIVRARAALDVEEAVALRDAQALRLWRHYGYASLLEYMELEMGYTPRVAIERLRVAKAIEDLPVIAEAMAQGDLSFSGARELTRVATPETEQAWLEAAQDKNVREVEALVSGHERGDTPDDPIDPTLRKRTLRYEEIAPETVALVRQARQILDRELGERLDDNGFLRALARRVIDRTHVGRASSGISDAAPERTRASERTRAPYQIAVMTCAQCKRGWQDGGGVTVEMSPPALETALCDAEHIGTVDGESTQRTKQDIPPAVRRKVLRRDHERCRVPGCRSSRNIDLHHIVPREHGGSHRAENLLALCESHHLAHHQGALIIEGTASNPRFTRRAHNSFALAERAIETKQALTHLGFKRHEVATAIEKTRTHVGTSELTLEQWIKIALSYCPRPTG